MYLTNQRFFHFPNIKYSKPSKNIIVYNRLLAACKSSDEFCDYSRYENVIPFFHTLVKQINQNFNVYLEKNKMIKRKGINIIKGIVNTETTIFHFSMVKTINLNITHSCHKLIYIIINITCFLLK